MNGFVDGVFYVDSTPSKKLCEWAERKCLIRYPTAAHRHYALGIGATKPASVFDSLPDEPEQPAAATP